MRRLILLLLLIPPFAFGTSSTPLGPPVNQYNVGRALWPLTSIESGASITWSQLVPYYAPGELLRYGAKCDGSTDDTTAFTRAGSTGYLIHVPDGVTCKVSSGISITGGGIYGNGSYRSTICTSDTASANVFTYTGTVAGVFRDFALQPCTTKTGGFGLVIQPSAGEVSGMRFQNLIFNGLPNAIDFEAASLWGMTDVWAYNCTGDCYKIQNTNNQDSGDSNIKGGGCNNATSTSANCIHYLGSGGLKVIGMKMNNGGVGLLLDLNTQASGSTSDLLVEGCSIENAHFSAFQAQRSSGTNIFTHIVFVGNQIRVASSSGTSSGWFSNNGSNFLSRVTVNDNVIFVNDTGAATGILADWINDFQATGNNIVGNGGTAKGIQIGGNMGGTVVVGPNNIRGMGSGANIPTTVQLVPGFFQTGTANVSASTAQGSLFQGANTITFPTAFAANAPPQLKDCSVAITSGGGGGGIAAYAVAVTATQFTYEVTSVTNGGSVPTRWSCGGIQGP